MTVLLTLNRAASLSLHKPLALLLLKSFLVGVNKNENQGNPDSSLSLLHSGKKLRARKGVGRNEDNGSSG